MYSELLQNSEEKLLLIAIDQRFINNENIKEEEEKRKEIKNEKNNEKYNSLEISLENLNVKFCESLDLSDSEKEISTEGDSDNSSVSEQQNKKFLFVNNFINFNKDEIKKIQDKIINEYHNQNKLRDMIKAIFKNNNSEKFKNKNSNLN